MSIFWWPRSAFAQVPGILLVVCCACRGQGKSSSTFQPEASITSGADPSQSSVELPAAPPYDLAADLARREAAEGTTEDGGVPGRIVGDVLLMVAPDRGSLFEPSVALVQRALGPLFHERFDQPPYQAVTILIFSTSGAYEKACQRRLGKACEERFGSYRPVTRTIFVNAERGISSVLHELTHAIMQNDFGLARAWIGEGIAAIYERPVFYGDAGITGSTNWRLDRLKQALASDKERPTAGIDALLAMSDEDFLGRDLDLHYAVAVMVCQWLDQRGLLWPFYRAWRGTVKQDPTGSAAFASVVGQSPALATPRWRDWVGRQRFVAGGWP